MLPALRGTNPKTAFSKEVFPRPDCPEMQAISPSCSCKQNRKKRICSESDARVVYLKYSPGLHLKANIERNSEKTTDYWLKSVSLNKISCILA